MRHMSAFLIPATCGLILCGCGTGDGPVDDIVVDATDVTDAADTDTGDTADTGVDTVLQQCVGRLGSDSRNMIYATGPESDEYEIHGQAVVVSIALAQSQNAGKYIAVTLQPDVGELITLNITLDLEDIPDMRAGQRVSFLVRQEGLLWSLSQAQEIALWAENGELLTWYLATGNGGGNEYGDCAGLGECPTYLDTTVSCTPTEEECGTYSATDIEVTMGSEKIAVAPGQSVKQGQWRVHLITNARLALNDQCYDVPSSWTEFVLTNTRPADPECPAATPVTTAEGAFTVLPADWSPGCRARERALPAGEAFEIAAPLELSAADIVLPEGVTCGEETPKCQVAFGLRTFDNNPERVEVLESVEIGGDDVPVRIKLQPGQYRWRTEVQGLDLDNLVRYARAVLMPGCDEPCPKGYTRCPTDMACYSPVTDFWANEYCLYCMGLGPTGCSCNSVDGPLPDGTDCAVMPDCEDSYIQGTCWHGTCAFLN